MPDGGRSLLISVPQPTRDSLMLSRPDSIRSATGLQKPEGSRFGEQTGKDLRGATMSRGGRVEPRSWVLVRGRLWSASLVGVRFVCATS